MHTLQPSRDAKCPAASASLQLPQRERPRWAQARCASTALSLRPKSHKRGRYTRPPATARAAALAQRKWVFTDFSSEAPSRRLRALRLAVLRHNTARFAHAARWGVERPRAYICTCSRRPSPPQGCFFPYPRATHAPVYLSAAALTWGQACVPPWDQAAAPYVFKDLPLVGGRGPAAPFSTGTCAAASYPAAAQFCAWRTCARSPPSSSVPTFASASIDPTSCPPACNGRSGGTAVARARARALTLNAPKPARGDRGAAGPGTALH